MVTGASAIVLRSFVLGAFVVEAFVVGAAVGMAVSILHVEGFEKDAAFEASYTSAHEYKLPTPALHFLARFSMS